MFQKLEVITKARLINLNRMATSRPECDKFECTFSDASVLKSVVASIKELSDEVMCRCNEDGIHLQAMDGSHVALFDVHLNTGEKLVLKQGEHCEVDFKLKLSALGNVLRCMENGHMVRISISSGNYMLKLSSFESGHPECEKVSFSLSTILIDGDWMHIPVTELGCNTVFHSSVMAKVIRDLSTFGDVLRFQSSQAGFSFYVQGDDGQGVVTLDNSDGIITDVTIPCNMSFASRYLLLFVKGSVFSDNVNINMTPNLPLQVSYENPGWGKVSFFLAPKIDTE